MLTAIALANQAAAADRKLTGWLKQYAALKCDPRSLQMQSREPLRFASTAVCYKLPKTFKRAGYRQLVLIDAARDELRLVDFGIDGPGESRLLSFDSAGNWFWLSGRDVMMLPPGETEPRKIANIEFPWPAAQLSYVGRGEGCQLITPPRGPGNRNDSAPMEYALLSYGTTGASVRFTPEIQVPRFWHPVEKAYVVRQEDRHVLIDCAGVARPLPDRDEARLAKLGKPKVESYEISTNGDWLVDLAPEESAFVVFQGDTERQLGPFNYTPRGCGHPDCVMYVPLFLPRWSPGGEFIAVETFTRITVIRTADFRSVKDWKLSSSSYAFISDHELMQLSKRHGAVFHRW